MIGSGRRAPYGRKRNSGSAALATLGDGWRPLAGSRGVVGPFGTAPDEAQEHGWVTHPDRLARYAVDLVLRDSTRARRTQL